MFQQLSGMSLLFLVLHGPSLSYLVLLGPSWSFLVVFSPSWSSLVLLGPWQWQLKTLTSTPGPLWKAVHSSGGIKTLTERWSERWSGDPGVAVQEGSGVMAAVRGVLCETTSAGSTLALLPFVHPPPFDAIETEQEVGERE